MQRTNTKQLSNWFDLSKYSAASKLTLAGWADNLWGRSLLFRANREVRNQAATWIEESLFATPLASNNLPTDLSEQAGRSFSEIIGPLDGPYDGESLWSALETRTVQSLRVLDVVNKVFDPNYRDDKLAKRILSEVNKRLVAAEADSGDVCDVLDEELEEFLLQPIDLAELQANDFLDPTRLHVGVNLGAPDALIIENFRTWLSVARQAYSIEGKNQFTDSDMEDWAKFQVLPYLDLTLWALIENRRIPNAVMGNALFPDEVDVDLPERVRKVVRRKAEWLIRPAVIHALVMQAPGSE